MLAPLMCIFIAIILSPWFNIFENALSDLGHATRSVVAPLFNLGLSLGGFIIGMHAVRYVFPRARIIGLGLVATGYSLILVALFDEVYGTLHFIVSVVLFISLAIMLLLFTIHERSLWPLLCLIIGIIAWAMHFVMEIPRGAAIPELVSILMVMPWYIKLLIELKAS
ncbi:MAG: hypothetical protein DRN15_08020 [Thermoprotei archaeon]|nr:MAG: hypothetical protein DRN15_08020 [Thermoprotei archaeon]